MLLRGWTAFLWLASGMCLAPHKPHHPQKRWTCGRRASCCATLALLLGICVPARKRHSALHISHKEMFTWYQCPQNNQELDTLLIWGEATTVPIHFFYWRVWFHLLESWRSHVFGSELRQEELCTDLNSNFMHFHFQFLRLLFTASRKYPCSRKFHIRLNPLIKHMEEREILVSHIYEHHGSMFHFTFVSWMVVCRNVFERE
jgi:hypothetical protein